MWSKGRVSYSEKNNAEEVDGIEIVGGQPDNPIMKVNSNGKVMAGTLDELAIIMDRLIAREKENVPVQVPRCCGPTWREARGAVKTKPGPSMKPIKVWGTTVGPKMACS